MDFINKKSQKKLKKLDIYKDMTIKGGKLLFTMLLSILFATTLLLGVAYLTGDCGSEAIILGIPLFTFFLWSALSLLETNNSLIRCFKGILLFSFGSYILTAYVPFEIGGGVLQTTYPILEMLVQNWWWLIILVVGLTEFYFMLDDKKKPKEQSRFQFAKDIKILSLVKALYTLFFGYIAVEMGSKAFSYIKPFMDKYAWVALALIGVVIGFYVWVWLNSFKYEEDKPTRRRGRPKKQTKKSRARR